MYPSDLNNRKRIMEILSMDEGLYNLELFETAYKYMSKLTGNYTEVISEITKEQMFWEWWKRQCQLVDELFLHFFDSGKLQRLDKETLRGVYRQMHVNIKAVPDKVVLEYNHMIQQVISQKTD